MISQVIGNTLHELMTTFDKLGGLSGTFTKTKTFKKHV